MRTAVSTLCLTVTLSIVAGLPDRATAFQPARVQQLVQFTEKTFDQISFGSLTAIGAERKCGESLQARMELLEKAVVISDAQRGKLELAGQLDIERFFAGYEGIKRKFKFGRMPQNEWRATVTRMQAEAKPMKAKFEAGIHGKSSLFAKTLTKTLDPDQLTSLQTLDQVRANRTYANYIRYTLAFLDPKVPLTKLQRETIIELMLQETTPPDSYGTSLQPAYRVLSRMAQIEDPIRDLFSDQEWARISEILKRAKAAAEE
jgi:hypothetical protein